MCLCGCHMKECYQSVLTTLCWPTSTTSLQLQVQGVFFTWDRHRRGIKMWVWVWALFPGWHPLFPNLKTKGRLSTCIWTDVYINNGEYIRGRACIRVHVYMSIITILTHKDGPCPAIMPERRPQFSLWYLCSLPRPRGWSEGV